LIFFNENGKVLLMIPQLFLNDFDIIALLTPLVALPLDERSHALA
jgi:hypothetical protein